MKSFLYLSLLIVAACGVKRTSFDYGKTTSADLIAEKGEPIEKTSTPIKGAEIFQYADNEKFQVKNDIVTHAMKDPKGDEKSVLYWKHKFKDCNTTSKVIAIAHSHEPALLELKCPSEGITIIYSDGSEFVSRIVEHEKQ